MKKFTKISLIIAGIMTVVGFGFVIAGSVIAGGMGALAAELRSGDLNFGNWHFENGVSYVNENVYNMADMLENAMDTLPTGSEHVTDKFSETITGLEIDTDLANITVKSSDVDEITVSLEDGYLNYYDVKIDGDMLHISYDVGAHTFKKGPKITVEVPEGVVLEHIYANTDLGEVRILNLRQPLVDLTINANLGNVKVEDCKVNGSGVITAALGNIEVDDSYFERLELSADTGNIEFSGSIEEDLGAQADMGNIDVELDGDVEDYNIELASDMGNVTFGGQKREGGMGGEFTSYHTEATAYIFLNCDMGDVELSFD